jgi:hypothetical protein
LRKELTEIEILEKEKRERLQTKKSGIKIVKSRVSEKSEESISQKSVCI